MTDREDLPFISLPDDDETKSRSKPAGKAPPAKPGAPPPKPPVDMVSRPAGRGPAPARPMTLPPAATVGEADSGIEKLELVDDGVDVAAVPDAELKPAGAPPAAKRPGPPPKPAPAPPPSPAERTTVLDESLVQRLDEQHRQVQDALRNYSRVLKERDEVRARLAGTEHELAQARQQLEGQKGELVELRGKARDLREKLDASLLNNNMLSTENGKLKMRAGELEEKARQLEQRSTASDLALKKAETALQNAKEARDDAERRIAAALAALQAKK